MSYYYASVRTLAVKIHDNAITTAVSY